VSSKTFFAVHYLIAFKNWLYM